MGKPGPQPRSMTLLPCDSVLAHFRTSFTPMAVDRVPLLPDPQETLARLLRIHWIDPFADGSKPSNVCNLAGDTADRLSRD